MKVLELYSGIGGMHYALRESGVAAEVVAAIDINPVANAVYHHNFPETILINRNIESLNVQELNKLGLNAILMSPPCQPFTRLGLKKDALDNRACSLLHILNLIPELKSLRYILLENVKGFEVSQMRDKLLLSQSKHSMLAEKSGKINTKSGRMCYTLDNILENVEESKYLLPSKLLQKRAWVLDIRTSENNGSCCFTKGYGHYAEGTGSVYCPFADETIKFKYSEAGNQENNSDKQVQLLSDLKLRFFSPKEVCRLMCFPEDFDFPKHITDRQKYRLLGNSINVYVISRLILLLHTENENI
ncbi:trna cytosine-c-methyltransferase-like protein [Lasius niger]|uniref:tRNA (cytosine(38)-C(5))-methyltransferase n=1 Tax=Lasius niger TaxID=67767 RepID=A0A0J7KLT1_LASNI|nr:trna cytosine-c-methyltransferase-like protein [Lasius niger]